MPVFLAGQPADMPAVQWLIWIPFPISIASPSRKYMDVASCTQDAKQQVDITFNLHLLFDRFNQAFAVFPSVWNQL